MRLLTTPEDIENCKILRESWKHPDIPRKQWESIWEERAYIENGEASKVPPFHTFIKAVNLINDRELREEMDILDAGASSGIYAKILQGAGFASWSYTAMDYSPAFQTFAKIKHPWLYYDLGDLTDMPYSDKIFKIVMTAITNLHVEDWQKAIDEAFRVARKYVIIHRVPIEDGPTSMWEDEAYGVKIIHTQYNRKDLDTYIAGKTKSHFITYLPIYGTNQFTIVIEKL